MTLCRRRLLVATVAALAVTTQPTARAEASAGLKEPTIRKAGRFTVLDYGDRMEIVGGEFTPPTDLPYAPSAKLKRTGVEPRHVIFINYARSELAYYRRSEDGSYEPIIGFAVVTPAAYPNEKHPEQFALRQELVRGEVTQIVAGPSWCPVIGGQILKDRSDLKPGTCFPYGHPRNPMGEYAFHIAWERPDWRYARLHGARQYPERFETVDTYGCTRLHDPALTELVRRLGPSAVAEGIEIVAHRQQTLLELAE